ncbi:MAG: hypothetical protein HGA90_02965 [Alphaproteobacteria bacterium]|nr:hypothetical protein [Alphaproteobacteria bacterium]
MTGDFSDLLSPFEGGVRLAVKAKPGSSRARAPKIVELAEGKQAVEIAVAAIAEDGKANKALLESLAKELGLKKNDLRVKTGTSARLKLIEIHGNTAFLVAKITAWLQQL